MQVLLIGGTRFTGPALVQQLLERGHEVAVFHRGQTRDPRSDPARQIVGDRKDTTALARAVAECRPDVVVDMIPFTAEDASGFMEACRGQVPRVIGLSSIDVYLAYGRIHRTEPGRQIRIPCPSATAASKSGKKFPTVERSGGGQLVRMGIVPMLESVSESLIRVVGLQKKTDGYKRWAGQT